MGSKVKELPLVFCVKVENYAQATTADGNHAGCLVVGLGDVGLEIVLVVKADGVH